PRRPLRVRRPANVMTPSSPRSDGGSPKARSFGRKFRRTFRPTRGANRRGHAARRSSSTSPFPCLCTLHCDDPIALVAPPDFLPLLLIPDPGLLASGPAQNGDDMAVSFQQSEAVLRGTRMLRTALGPAIAGFLEDPSIVEVMLNPDGRPRIDRLPGGLADTGERPSPAERARAERGRHGGFIPAIRGGPSRHAYAAHGAWPGHRRLPGRPVDRRGDAQPGRAALDRPALRGPRRHGRASVARRRRAHRAA